MSLAEAARHVERFRSDPSTALAAEVEGWEYPMSRESAILMDLWDLEHAKAGTKKHVRYPRPFPEARDEVRHGNAAGRTPEQVKAILAQQFGQPETPV